MCSSDLWYELFDELLQVWHGQERAPLARLIRVAELGAAPFDGVHVYLPPANSRG